MNASRIFVMKFSEGSFVPPGTELDGLFPMVNLAKHFGTPF
jgi:hypothetical protein